MGFEEDLENCEENGSLKGASLDHVSKTAIKRGLGQSGSLGAGNHFLEIQKVSEIFDEETARVFGLFQDQIVIMIHTGSRGFGYQICEDYLQLMNQVKDKYKINLPDRQLSSAPIDSKEGQQYFSAMAAASNYAWTNRQVLTHDIRKIFAKITKIKPEEIKLLYDVAHNIAKFEEHKVDNKKMRFISSPQRCHTGFWAASNRYPCPFSKHWPACNHSRRYGHCFLYSCRDTNCDG